MSETPAKRVRQWYWTLTRTRRVYSTDASPETSTMPWSPVSGLPPEIVGMIIDPIYQSRSLLPCSLTCYSWHIATIPYLYHTLVISTRPRGIERLQFLWPKPFLGMYKLGFLPLVKRTQVHGDRVQDFSPTIVQLLYSTPFFRINQRPGTRDRLLEYPQVHAEDPTIFWSLLAHSPFSRLESTQRVPPPDPILHRTLSAPGRPRTPIIGAILRTNQWMT